MIDDATEARPEWVRYVASNMRDDDFREIGSSMFSDSRDDVIEKTVFACNTCPDMLWTMWYQDTPCWIGGAFPRRPGVWELSCFGTDDFHHIKFGVTRLATRVIIPAVLRSGAHRVYATTAAWRHGGAKWLEVLGMEYESTRQRELSDGSDLLVYAITREPKQ